MTHLFTFTPLSGHNPKKGCIIIVNDFRMEKIGMYINEDYSQYLGLHPKPDDFEAFWQQELDGVKDHTTDFIVTDTKEYMKNVKMQDGYLTSFDGVKIAVRYAALNSATKDAPGLVMYHGYTERKSDFFLLMPYVLAGFHVLSMDCRDQGGLSFDSGPVLHGNIIRGFENGPAGLYLKKNYLDALIAYRWLKNKPEINAQKVGVTGFSQGGTLSLVTAALDHDVSFAAVSSPFLSDFRMVKKLNRDVDVYEELGWYYRKYDPQHRDEDRFHDTLAYVDLKNFTPMVEAPTIWLLGMKDPTSPPATQYAAYNGLQCEKKLEVYPDAVHELYPGMSRVSDQVYEFIMQFL